MEWPDEKRRCRWANPKNPAYIAYHDAEWGRPLHDDRVRACVPACELGTVPN